MNNSGLNIVDREFLVNYVKSGTAEAWAPKRPYLVGEVTELDVAQYSGWAKLGCLLFTAERVEFKETNTKIAQFMERMFKTKGSYLLCKEDDMGFLVNPNAINY